MTAFRFDRWPSIIMNSRNIAKISLVLQSLESKVPLSSWCANLKLVFEQLTMMTALSMQLRRFPNEAPIKTHLRQCTVGDCSYTTTKKSGHPKTHLAWHRTHAFNCST